MRKLHQATSWVENEVRRVYLNSLGLGLGHEQVIIEHGIVEVVLVKLLVLHFGVVIDVGDGKLRKLNVGGGGQSRSILVIGAGRGSLGVPTNATDIFGGLVVDPAIDVGIVAVGVDDEGVFELGELVDEAAVLGHEVVVLLLEGGLCVFEVVNPVLLLLATLGRGDAVALQAVALAALGSLAAASGSLLGRLACDLDGV